MLDRAGAWVSAHRLDLALAALVLAVSAPLVHDQKAQQSSRLALTAAIWDQRTLAIDDYPIGVDRVERDGHVYSDKAPGQPLFALPAYGLYRALGGEPAVVHRIEENLGLWAVTLWSATAPAAALVVLLRRIATRWVPEAATAAAASVGLATLLLPFSSVLFGHALAALLAVWAWAVIGSSRVSDGALIGAGALLGASVLTEYTLVLAAAAIAAAAVHRFGLRARWLLAGGLPFLGLLLAYQWAAFGGPLRFSYASSSFGAASRELGDRDHDPALLANAARVLLGERGLLVVTPLVALAVVGTVVLIRRCPRADRSIPLAGAASALGLVAVQAFWSNPTGGDAPGPRYATAAAAFLVPGLTLAWSRWPRWAMATAGFGGVVMLAATWTDPLEARDSRGAVGIWLGQLLRGEWASTIYELAWGQWAVALLPVGAALAGVAVALTSRRAHDLVDHDPDPGAHEVRG